MNGVSSVRAYEALSTVREGFRLYDTPTRGSAWLAENGIEPTRRERLVSLPVTYLLMPYWRNIAQAMGALRGRRRRSKAHAGRP